MGVMCDMYGWCVGIVIDGNYFYVEMLIFDCYFFI